MPHLSKNKMTDSHKELKQRRTTNPEKHRLIKINNENYHTTQYRHQALPTTLNSRTGSNRSGPLYNSRKLSKRRRREKNSFKNLNNIASKSMNKPIKENPHYMQDSENINPEQETSAPNPYEESGSEQEPTKTHITEEKSNSHTFPDPISEDIRKRYAENPHQKRPNSYHRKLHKPGNHRENVHRKLRNPGHNKFQSIRKQRGLSIRQKNEVNSQESKG